MIRRFLLVSAIVLGFVFFIAPTVQAAGLIVEPSTVCDAQGQNCRSDYTIEDFFRQFILLARWGLGIVGILSVIMFIWAGVLFVTAAGASTRIDEGKRIITGTFTGIIISLAAFVIVNTVIAALTGTSLRSTDFWAGNIATIFSSKDGDKTINGVKLERPFSGVGTVDTRGSCRGSNNTEWDKTCSSDSLHLFCADPGTDNSGIIHGFQSLLIAKGCTCLTTSGSSDGIDGCFGNATAQCLRHFQAVNRLPLTGNFDAETKIALTSETATNCNFAYSNPIVSKLPAIAAKPSSTATSSATGCCLVGDSAGLDYYCADSVTEQHCSALSGLDDRFDSGQQCGTSQKFRGTCGFCQNVAGQGFQYATERWCKNIATQTLQGADGPEQRPTSFLPGTCIGRGLQSCKTTLLLTPEQ